APDVKGRLVEREVAAGRNRRAVRDAVFLRVVEVVGQVPAGEVDVGAFEIEQLDPIDGRIAVREGFVDDNAGQRGWSLVLAGRAIEHSAGPPLGLGAPGAGRGVFVHYDQREPQAIGDGIPAGIILEVKD